FNSFTLLGFTDDVCFRFFVSVRSGDKGEKAEKDESSFFFKLVFAFGVIEDVFKVVRGVVGGGEEMKREERRRSVTGGVEMSNGRKWRRTAKEKLLSSDLWAVRIERLCFF
nr:origin of replication complex subunit 1A-like [Tanacetum cinerariifolium]